MKTRTSFLGEGPIVQAPLSKPSRDHQGQVSIIATLRQSLMAGNGLQEP
jgi:hypothetical protein